MLRRSCVIQTGRFVQPINAEDMAAIISRMALPVAAFVEDECEIDPNVAVAKDQLNSAFRDWCGKQDRVSHGHKETFGKSMPVYRGPGFKANRRFKWDGPGGRRG